MEDGRLFDSHVVRSRPFARSAGHLAEDLCRLVAATCTDALTLARVLPHITTHVHKRSHTNNNEYPHVSFWQVDLMEDTAAFSTVMSYVQDHSRAVLGTSPKIFAVSSRQAMHAKVNGDVVQLESSNFDKLVCTAAYLLVRCWERGLSLLPLSLSCSLSRCVSLVQSAQ